MTSSPLLPDSRQPSREDLLRWDRQHVWHAFTQMAEYEPLIFTHAQGCLLHDLDGHALIDGVSSLWCNVHGHRHPRLDAALVAQLGRVAHTTLLGASNPPAIELAHRLVQLAPPGLEHVFYSDDGATAIEVALKMTVQFWRQRPQPKPEKTRFLCFDQAYHGDTIGGVSVGGVVRFRQTFAPLLFPTVQVPAPDTYRLPVGITADVACDHYLSLVEQALAEHHETLAGVIIEPLVQCAAGMLMHPPGFLAGLRHLTRKYDVLLIADEVAVGFGRTGKLFACEHENVSPDFLCLAKGITAGYLPLAATLTTDSIFSAFLGTYTEGRVFFHGHTYGGNPLAAAVALASLAVFEEENVLANLAPKIERLSEHLARLTQLPHVGSARQRGLIGAVELVENTATRQPFPVERQVGQRVCRKARELGVWLRPLGPVVVIMPPLAVSLDQLDTIAHAVESGILAATRS